jgi:hypothetical protein
VKSRLSIFVDRVKHFVGLDRAIAYTALARCVTIVGSTGTVLLLVHFLTPIEQGYYYALLSLVSLQTIFEMGFSSVVQQLAAHESAHLQISRNGILTGPSAAHSRLASIFQLMVRWYSRAAIIMVLVLLPGGWLFFFHRPVADHVSWQLPWTLAAIACAGTFLLGPFYSFLDGCSQIREVAGMRLREGCAALIMAWFTMILHRGLYAPAMVILGQSAVGIAFILRYRRLLLGLYRYPSARNAVSWRSEVLPFQWKIAVSWMCTYFTAQAFIPLLFTLRGTVEAGQMGMCLSITSYISVLILAWMSTKATSFGQMIARGAFGELNKVFFRTLWQSMPLLGSLAAAAMVGIEVVQRFLPKLAHRMVTPSIFALLLLTMMSNFVIQSLAVYLRSFKREPFLVLNLTIAGLSLGMVLLTARQWGNMGVAISYFICTGLAGLIFAIFIFRKQRQLIAVPLAPVLQGESIR